MFEAIRISYWWPKLWQDIVKYIDKCSLCAKHLSNMAWYPQQHLVIPQSPMAVLAIDTIGCLPIPSNGNRWSLTAICLHTSYMFAILMKEKSAENVQAYLFGILDHIGRSVAILSDNGTEVKNKVLNEVCDQLAINRLFSIPFNPQGNAKMENTHNLLRRTSPNSWTVVI